MIYLPAILSRIVLKMPIFNETIPLSLYVHIPWCVRKCPYCDFNSHTATGALPEEAYVAGLMQDLDKYLPMVSGRELSSIFFGGGTPSLFSAHAIEKILRGVEQRLPLGKHIEITLEANPGTIDQKNFKDFRTAGINRLSLGVQSLQDTKLKVLGRIHDRANAMEAIQIAKKAGFDNFNLDIMYGLPEQTIEDALNDINDALEFNPKHFSWYQLTIEPNTVFYRYPPPLPQDDYIWEMQVAGQALLKSSGFEQYEVSAYAQQARQCIHNLNYWEFGDYLGIGAGAHSKITLNDTVVRFAQVRQPATYLARKDNLNLNPLTTEDLIFEFMLNALRLTNGVPVNYFKERTGLDLQTIAPELERTQKLNLLHATSDYLCATEQGARYLNDLLLHFSACTREQP